MTDAGESSADNPASGGDLVVAEFQKNSREIVRIRLTTFRGVDLVDVRSFYQDGGDWKPGKGLSLRRELLPALLKCLRAAEKASKEQSG